MLLDLMNNFSMDVKKPDGKTDTLKAYFREFTKDEKIEQDKLIDDLKEREKEAKKIAKQIKRTQERIDMLKRLDDYEAAYGFMDTLYELEDELEEKTSYLDGRDLDAELMEYRFNTCLGGEDADTIMEYAKTQGYVRVFEVIRKSIQEAQEKN